MVPQKRQLQKSFGIPASPQAMQVQLSAAFCPRRGKLRFGRRASHAAQRDSLMAFTSVHFGQAQSVATPAVD